MSARRSVLERQSVRPRLRIVSDAAPRRSLGRMAFDLLKGVAALVASVTVALGLGKLIAMLWLWLEGVS